MLLVVPGSGKLIFDGVPFDTKLEFFSFVVLLFYLFAPKTYVSLREWIETSTRKKSACVFFVLILVLVVKFGTFIYSPLPRGFEVCYRSIYAPLAAEECEKSYDLPFISTGNSLKKISSVEKSINFGSVDGGQNTQSSNWRLPFLNDWGRLEPLWLVRIPFTADFAGEIEVKSDSWVPIIFLGEILVEINEQVIRATDYEDEASTLPVFLPKGKHDLIINYRFSDDGQNIFPLRQPTVLGDYAVLRVLQPVKSLQEVDSIDAGSSLPIISSKDDSIVTTIASWILNLVMFVGFLFLLLKVFKNYKNYFLVTPIIIVVVWLVSRSGGVISAVGLSRSMLLIGTIYGLGFLAMLRKFSKYVWLYGAAIGLVHVGLKFMNSTWWNVPQFRQRDSDWFVHQGLARTIFTENSLRGGESVFYFQPAMRYLIFVGHLILGNNDILISVLLVVALFASFAVALQKSEVAKLSLGLIPILSMAALVILFSSNNMISYVYNLTTELPTWIFLFTFVYLVCKSAASKNSLLTLCLIAGFAVNFRPNQAPGWGFLVVVFVLLKFRANKTELRPRSELFFLGFITILVGCLSLIHNIYFGRSFVVFSTSNVGSQQYQWKIFMDMFHDAESRRIVLDKLKFLTQISLNPLPKGEHWQTTNSFQLMHIIWIVGVLKALTNSRRFLTNATYALMPLAFLLPMVLFDATSYFPRHIVIINLSILASGVLMLFEAKPLINDFQVQS